MQIENMMRYLFTLTKMGTLKKKITSVGEDVKLLCTVGGN